jgi:signal transduction histidine kinase
MNPDSYKVLLVEDNEADARLTKAMLSHNHSTFMVEHVSSYDEAITRLAQSSFDICLIDLKLGGLHDGLDLMRAATSTGFLGPSIILTGTEDTATETQAIQNGAADYLIKGHYDTDILNRVIRHALERQRARTQLKQAENELRRARDELEDRVHRRTRELSKAVTALESEITRRVASEQQLREAIIKLERHNKEKSEFVANVSHELKTPITSIMYGTRNLLKGIAGPLPDQAVHYLKMFDSECERLVNTINRILDLGRLDSHALTISPITAPLNHLIKRTVEPLRIQADAARISLVIDNPHGSDFVHCDPGMLQRVLQNILSNAIKYTPGGGKVSIHLSVLEQQPAMVAISVTDNGIGIPTDALQRITERYFRVGTHISGTGLGLAISKEIMSLHGGSLSITSPPPNARSGTCVTITLPLAQPPHILIANNNLSIQAMLSAQLHSKGYHLDVVTRSDALLQAAKRNPPAIILLDLLLEDINGAEVILQLKETSGTRHIPIVAITGSSVNEPTADILERFSIPVLRKPWQAEELTELVESTLIGVTVFNPAQKETSK